MNISNVLVFWINNGCRVRFGYAHVANNRYDEWKMYAIGGSANPTIFSEGNYFVAPQNSYAKQVLNNSKSTIIIKNKYKKN